MSQFFQINFKAKDQLAQTANYSAIVEAESIYDAIADVFQKSEENLQLTDVQVTSSSKSSISEIFKQEGTDKYYRVSVSQYAKNNDRPTRYLVEISSKTYADVEKQIMKLFSAEETSIEINSITEEPKIINECFIQSIKAI